MAGGVYIYNFSMARPTFTTARIVLARLGIKLTRLDGEYRVTFSNLSPEQAENVAYYTSDLTDAIQTADAMLRYAEAESATESGIYAR